MAFRWFCFKYTKDISVTWKKTETPSSSLMLSHLVPINKCWHFVLGHLEIIRIIWSTCVQNSTSSQCLPNSCRTLEAPTPTNISSNSEPEQKKKGTSASPAIALANRVFPVPGGPTKSMPMVDHMISCDVKFHLMYLGVILLQVFGIFQDIWEIQLPHKVLLWLHQPCDNNDDYMCLWISDCYCT